MADTRLRDMEHACKLAVARQLIDDIWKGAEGCATDEGQLRAFSRTLFAWEKQLRESVVLPRRRAKEDSA